MQIFPDSIAPYTGAWIETTNLAKVVIKVIKF